MSTKFKIRKYIVFEGSIEAESPQDAATLLKYGAYKTSWREVSSKVKLYDINEVGKVYFLKGNIIDDNGES